MTDQHADDFTPDPARWRALAVCLVAGAMTLLDVSIVNVALPTLRAGLKADDSDVQWIIAGYALAFGVALVPAGRLGDARSRRTIFLIGVTLFTLASAAAGASPTPAFLSVARVLQGLAAGLISPQVSGFIQNLFRGPERGRAFGLFGASIGISTAVGPLLGGLLVKLGGPDFGWRLVFYVNVPVGIALVLLARRVLPKVAGSRRQSLDPVGVLLFAAAILLVLFPLVEGTQGAPLSDRPWWLLAVAAVLLVAFYLWERHWRSRGHETLIELSLLRVRSYVFGVVLGSFYFAGFTSIFLILTLYLQTGLHYSALQAGATGTSFAIGSAVAALLGGRLVQRFGRYLVVAGLVLVAAGLVAVDLLVPHVTNHVGLTLAPALLVAGLGGGLVITPNVTLTLAEVNPAQAGSGGGMLQTAQRVGSAIGVAIVLAQFFDEVAASRGQDYAGALSTGLRTTLGFVGVALLFGLADLVRRRTVDQHPEPRHAMPEPEPRHAAG
ncbi:MFS transporter [uncultured Friedmanniella sp.]|uniref:MFS transporter n=1 Tax=uncultured Friedmanniella sp. TaxID=335381 RepID=UPI0035C9F4AC